MAVLHSCTHLPLGDLSSSRLRVFRLVVSRHTRSVIRRKEFTTRRHSVGIQLRMGEAGLE